MVLLDLQQREIKVRGVRDCECLEGLTGRERDLDDLRVSNDMVIRQDIAVRTYDNSGPEIGDLLCDGFRDPPYSPPVPRNR